MDLQQSLANLKISRPLDSLENLMYLVTNQIEKRNAILSFAESKFNHNTFYSSNTQQETSSNSNLYAKNFKPSFSLQELKSGGVYSSSSLTNTTKSTVDVLQESPSTTLSSSSSSLSSSMNYYQNDKLTPSASSDSVTSSISIPEKETSISESIVNDSPRPPKANMGLFASVSQKDFDALKRNYLNFMNIDAKITSPKEKSQLMRNYSQIQMKRDHSLKRSKYFQRIQKLNNHAIKPQFRITSFEDEVTNVFQRINFNNIEPSAYDFNEWKRKIVHLKSRDDLRFYALAKSSLDFQNLDDLVKFLKRSPAKQDIEKVWLIFVWITEHIAYDDESYVRRKCEINEPEDVLAYGKCTCEGFAMIFKYLCNRLDFECIRISGYSKGAYFDSSEKLEQTDHSWNAVKIDDRWELVDCTWGVGYVRENVFLANCGEFVKQFQPFYFFTPPQFFIYDHFSEDYQLQPERITLEQFRLSPKFEVFYHMFEMECVSHKKADIVTTKGLVNFRFKCPNTTEMIAKLKDSRGVTYEETVYYGRNPITNEYEVKVSIPRTRKKFSLILYGKYARDNDEIYKETGRYFITFIPSEKPTRKKLIRNTAALKNAFISKPVFSELPRKSLCKFRVYCKNAKSLALIETNGNVKFFERDEIDPNFWCLDYVVTNVVGRIYLGVKLNNREDFKEMCKYNVI
jgi:transglutaminase/protease-like cytokinesis protein 3